MPKNPADTNWIIALDGDTATYGTLSDGLRRLTGEDYPLEHPDDTLTSLRLLAAQLDAPEQPVKPAFRDVGATGFARGGNVEARPRELRRGDPGVVVGLDGALVDVLPHSLDEDPEPFTAETALAEAADKLWPPVKHLLGVEEAEDGRKTARFGSVPLTDPADGIYHNIPEKK